MYKNCVLFVLFKVCNTKGLDDSLDNLGLSRYHEIFEHDSHSFIKRESSEIHLSNVMLSDVTCKLVNVPDQLSNISQI